MSSVLVPASGLGVCLNYYTILGFTLYNNGSSRYPYLARFSKPYEKMRMLHIPGLDKHPDLLKRFEFEQRRVKAGCNLNCGKGEMIQRYNRLLRDREQNSRLEQEKRSRY